jgi:oligopeptidase A
MNSLLNLTDFPAFNKILPEHIEPAISHILTENRETIKKLEQLETPTFENFVQVLEDLEDRLETTWGIVSHLHNVADNDELRNAYNACLPLISAYHSENGQNQILFKHYQTLKNSFFYPNFSQTQKQIIDNELKEFHLSGVDLSDAKKDRFKEIKKELSQLSSQFGQHLLDATHAWQKHILSENELEGLPESTKSVAKQTAEEKGLDGWILTLDLPCYLSVMNYAKNQDLREEIYRGFVTRASELGDEKFDNSAVMFEIVNLRQQMANLLNFKHYSDYSLAKKMAESPEQVVEFLLDLAKRAKPFGERDLYELKGFAKTEYGIAELNAWDIPYYSERLKEYRYSVSQEILRPYFPLPKVLKGLFQIIEKLFNISIQKREHLELWHENAECYEIVNQNNEIIGQFYFDPFVRKGKRGGAWVSGFRPRKIRNAKIQKPAAFVVCNFAQPIGEKPSLLTHQEVTTLFHEFGHALHHLLTEIEEPAVSGINGVAWDAVELPSQMLENWAWEKEALDLFAQHYQTGEQLPEELFQKMQAAKNFQMGLFMLRQIEFAVFDFRLHWEFNPQTNIQQLLDEVRKQVAVIIPPDFNRFQHSFGHIFSGGYAAGYYSYKWAEVLSADAFSLFEEKGIFDRETGLKFREHILAKGGSQSPMTLFKRFRGREPSIDALLRHCGMK